MDIALITSQNFNRNSLANFSRHQVVKNMYRLTDGALHLVCNPFTEDWSPEQGAGKAEEILRGNHIVYGAFEGGEVIGGIMLLPTLDHGRMIIDSFHVSAAHRRRGIGRALLQAAKTEAVGRGANALYVSACSAQETIDFYMAMGFTVSRRPIPSRVADEPFDIQMECKL